MIFFNIYGFNICVESKSNELLDRLKIEFSFFSVEKLEKTHFRITSNLTSDYPTLVIPSNLKSTFQRHNSITYDQNNIRWNDYYGKVISKIDFEEKYSILTGVNFDKLFEITYLLVLSISGKHLDLNSLHKIHALAFCHNKNTFICMQPSRGGKSTLLMELIQKYPIELLSDDTPLLSPDLKANPFPLHIGVEDLPPFISEKNINYFIFNREFLKPKFSIDIKSTSIKIAGPKDNLIFIEVKRSTYTEPKLVKISKIKLFRYLFKHLVIGIGLPIIFEYFWESGTKDFFRKSRIFCSRLILAIRLSNKYPGFILYQSNSPEKNANAILSIKSNA